MVKQRRVVHVKEAVLQPGISLPPGCPQHRAEIVVPSERRRHGVLLDETLPHRMNPGDIADRQLGTDRAPVPVRLLSVDRGIDIIDGHAVADRVRKRRRHHMAVIGIGQCLGPGFADAERTDGHTRIHIGVVFRRGPVEGRQRSVRRPAG